MRLVSVPLVLIFAESTRAPHILLVSEGINTVTMENLIQLVNRLQKACTALGDHGEESALPTLWDALPSIAVVGGQVLNHLYSRRSYGFLFIGTQNTKKLNWYF